MSLFSVLGTAVSGLNASQLGMDITGQNIANADVEGYSRKRLNNATAYRYDEKFKQMGYGVETINIERMRNTFIDIQIRSQNQQVGYYDEINSTLETIENIFTEPSDSGLLNFMDGFFDSWENLANNPADISARTMVKTNGEILTDVFHNLAGELSDLRQNTNEEINNRINRVNKITKSIYNLNLEIATVEMNDQNANDSRDERTRLLKELSELIDIDTIENDRGQVTVTTRGNIIVSPVDYQEIETATSTFTMADGTRRTELGLRFANSKREYIPSGGKIKGLIDSRDLHIPEYQTDLDTLAVTLVEKINELHSTGYNLLGYSGVNFFNPSVTGASDISISPSIISSEKNIAAASGGEIQSSVDNVSTTTIDPPVNLSHTNLLPANLIVTDQSTSTVLTAGVDYTVNYTSGTLTLLNAAYDNQPITVEYQYYDGGFAGAGDNKNAIAIAELRQSLVLSDDGLGNSTATFDQFYGSFIGKLGLNRNDAQANLDTRTHLVNQYETHQEAIAGVSIDEEMSEMIKYQHTYQASAKIIATANRMLDILMNI